MEHLYYSLIFNNIETCISEIYIIAENVLYAIEKKRRKKLKELIAIAPRKPILQDYEDNPLAEGQVRVKV